jgi:integrase/recombinase XerD
LVTTPLRKRMLDELQLRNLSANTIERYISIVQQFARHFGKSPEKLGAEHVREYLLYMMREKKAAANTVLLCRAALRFLYLCTLSRLGFMRVFRIRSGEPRCPAFLARTKSRAC